MPTSGYFKSATGMRAMLGVFAAVAMASASAHGGGRDASVGVRQVQRSALNEMVDEAAASDSALFVRFYMNG